MKDPDMISDSQLIAAAAHELAITPARLPERRTIITPEGQSVSALFWPGEGSVCVAFHGGFENAHIWDMVHVKQSARVLEMLRSQQPVRSRAEVVEQWQRLHPPRSTTYLAALVDSLYAFTPAAKMNADLAVNRWEPDPTNIEDMWAVVADLAAPVELFVGGKSNVVQSTDIDHFKTVRKDGLLHTITHCGHHIPLHEPHEIALHIATG